jgi:hypothetical protein
MLISLSWAHIVDIAPVVAAGAAAWGLWYTARQIRRNTRAQRATFFLKLVKLFQGFNEVHVKLRPGGDWSTRGPSSADEWASVEGYMGLFEHCEIMLKSGVIDKETFERLFAYRLKNIVSNQAIVREKLDSERELWQDFLNLPDRLKIQVSDQSS